jgi:tetratricopeptide (TPR) repeat protein
MKARLALIVLWGLLHCGIAGAQENLSGCSAANLDVRIAACSALIQAGNDGTSDFSLVFNNRGIGYAGKGEYDQAILDYDEAIYLNSKFALAYSNRGVTYEAKRQDRSCN